MICVVERRHKEFNPIPHLILDLLEARADVAVVSTSTPAQRPRRKGRKVGANLYLRREVLRQMIPQYREASPAHKRVVLEDFVRLIPSLSMFLDYLERHERLHLTPECRTQLLSMSVATADRLLRPHRQQEMRGLCTTRAGTLLKSTIPIRTFEQWDELVLGFVEANLVAHCDTSVEGSYLFTLTLTDIATGWTECLPLLSKSAEAMLAAIYLAWSLFPFPVTGRGLRMRHRTLQQFAPLYREISSKRDGERISLRTPA